ncbi:hypothetical protein GCM10009834_11150 [Streptomonospora arabica]
MASGVLGPEALGRATLTVSGAGTSATEHLGPGPWLLAAGVAGAAAPLGVSPTPTMVGLSVARPYRRCTLPDERRASRAEGAGEPQDGHLPASHIHRTWRQDAAGNTEKRRALPVHVSALRGASPQAGGRSRYNRRLGVRILPSAPQVTDLNEGPEQGKSGSGSSLLCTAVCGGAGGLPLC